MSLPCDSQQYGFNTVALLPRDITLDPHRYELITWARLACEPLGAAESESTMKVSFGNDLEALVTELQ